MLPNIFTKIIVADPPKIDDLFSALDLLPNLIYSIGMFLSLAMMLLGGYMWITAAGDPQKAKKAQGVLTWAVLGVVFLNVMRVLLLFIFEKAGIA